MTTLHTPYWTSPDGRHVIYCADCLTVLPHLTGVDAVVTDPFYGIQVGNNQSAKETRPGLLVKGAYTQCADTVDEFKAIVVPAISFSVKTFSRVAVFGFAPNIWLLPPPSVVGGVFVPAGCGRNKWGWTNFMPVCLYGSAPDLQLGAKRTSIDSCDTAEKNGHPTPKPESWMEWLVDLVSRSNETVADCFMGSGTTGVACIRTGRRFIGVELEPKYCRIAVERMERELSQPCLPTMEPEKVKQEVML
jgi:DNA modification methylase